MTSPTALRINLTFSVEEMFKENLIFDVPEKTLTMSLSVSDASFVF